MLVILGIAIAPVSAQNNQVQVNFPNTSISGLLPYYEKLTGKRIIRDANLDGGSISVVTDAILTKEEAIRFIDSTLLLNGFAILPVDADTLKIVNYTGDKSIRAQELPVITDPTLLPRTEQVINYVMNLDHVSPDEAISTFAQIVTLNPYGTMTPLKNGKSIVINESTPVLRMLINIKNHVYYPPSEISNCFVRLERADAERVAEIVSSIIDQQAKQSGSGEGVSGTTDGGDADSTITASLGGANFNSMRGVTVVPYQRTNSILVVAPPTMTKFMTNLIRSFDQPSDRSNFMKRKLRYVSVLDYMPSFYNALARSTDISNRDDLLSADTSAGGGFTATSGNTELAGFGATGTSGSNSSATRNLLGTPDDVGTPISYMVGNTLLIGDPQANSLIVSGSPDNIQTIERLIAEIDVQPMQVYLSTVIGQMTIGDDLDYSMEALQTLGTFRGNSRMSGAGSLLGGSANLT
ncbi:MAG: secretin N-terminal domain-containing protein, partial [Verrucomicrobiota bacterium]